MAAQEILYHRFQLVPVETRGLAFSATTRASAEGGEVRFDNVPPGRYFVRVGLGQEPEAPHAFSTEVVVRSGEVTEVAARLP